MITTSLIREELQEMKRIKIKCQKRQASASCRSLHTRFEHGKPRPYTYINGKPTYISRKNTALLKKITQSRALDHLLPKLTHNIQLLEQLLSGYTPLPDLFSAESITPIIQTLCQDLDGTPQKKDWSSKSQTYLQGTLYPLLQNHITDKEILDWLAKPYEPSPIHPEQKLHRTPGGVSVRSKSELLLGTHFEHNHIPYKYEMPLLLAGNIIHPDFTILHPKTRKLLYWEHLGMMDDPQYAGWNLQKLLTYFEYGYLPYVNLIVTYDKNGTLDMSQVDQIISALNL